uniref:Capsid protein n=1 Tax=Wenling lepidotrigla astrovirus TaxID=2116417 RepID=A0A2P1GMD4_9VIRU|nr:capsid protein [Wenling lepidotrigla astrovirus]
MSGNQQSKLKTPKHGGKSKNPVLAAAVNKKKKKRNQPGAMRRTKQRPVEPWGLAGPTIPSGVTTRDVRGDTFTFIVGKVNGTEDDWGTPLSIQVNPRVVAVQSQVPRLRVMANMYQKYRVHRVTIEATPLVSAAGVSGTMLMLSEGGSANSPTPPENVNTCKERNGSICALGEHAKFTWVPPKRQYLCRPDGDVSETTPGVVFVSTYLPTTTVLNAAPYKKPLWVISATVQYDFSVFEDPAKNVEDSIVSEPLTGELKIQQDENGAPVITGDTVSRLTSVQRPHDLTAKPKFAKNTKNGIMLATGIVATAANAIPGPLGILLRAGCVIVKLVVAAIAGTGENAVPTTTAALKIYGSVDDALEDRALTAPGLIPTSISADGAVTTISVGQNPITTSTSTSNDMAAPHVQGATSADTFFMLNTFDKATTMPLMTSTTGMQSAVNLDNVGRQNLNTSGYTMTKPAKARVVMVNPDGNIWYEGPVAGCPTNATYNTKRCVAWMSREIISGTTVNDWWCVWDTNTGDIKIQQKVGGSVTTKPTGVFSGYTGTSATLWTDTVSGVGEDGS